MSAMKLMIGVYLVAVILLLAACAQGQTVIEPPTIHYGEDLCAACGMIISDARFACGYLYEVSPERYESLIFDDIGDMLAYAAQHPEQQIQAWYVHDFVSEEWLDATQAYYVVSTAIQTPMGHGVVAFAELGAAQAKAAELQAELLDWPAMLQRYQVNGATKSLSAT